MLLVLHKYSVKALLEYRKIIKYYFIEKFSRWFFGTKDWPSKILWNKSIHRKFRENVM
jgi:hypothetical protein